MTRDRSKPPGKTRKSKAPSWVKRIHMALKQWHGPGTLSSPFADLYLYRTLARQPHITPRQATNQLLLAALNELEILYDEDAHLLRLRFLDGWPIQRLANHLNVAEGTAFANQRRAMERLADCLQEMERKASANQRATLKGRLEAQAYTNLIGVEEQIEHLLALWTQAEPPWIFAVEGIGGIGKTTLVDAVMRRIITECRFDEIGWVSARSAHMHPSGALLAAPAAPSTPEAVVIQLVKQLMPNHGALGIVTLEQMLGALKTQLASCPHLIVIDNLETVADVESLLPTLQDLANPSRFVLTSRMSYHADPTVYHWSAPALNKANALKLIRQEARLGNLPVLADCSDAELRPIYDAVGGNPLALRLIVGQTYIHSLESVLDDLRTARGEPVQNLYTYIYRQAWLRLNERGQELLMAMLHVNEQGEELSFIADVSGMTVGDVRTAMNHLVRLNLADARGGLNQRRYSIHPLTRSFLQGQVLGW